MRQEEEEEELGVRRKGRRKGLRGEEGAGPAFTLGL